MNLSFAKRVGKDIERFRPEVRKVIVEELQRLQKTETLAGMGNVEKMQGMTNKYKLKKGDFRILMEKKEDGTIDVQVIADRKDVYMKKNRG